MKEKTRSSHISFNNNIILIELFLSTIQENEVIVNPGVVGCGIVIDNLSKKSIDEFDMFSDELIKIYHNSIVFENHNGSIEKEKIIL